MLKNILKLILDLAMGIVFALLFNHKILGGMTFHEIAGLAIGGAVVAHILLNAKWVKAMVRKIFSCGTPAKSRLEAVLNILLLVCLIVVLVSGVMKSKVLFPSIAEQFRDGNILGIHVGVSYVMLVLLGIHLGLHRQWLLSTLRNLLKIKGSNATRRVVANVLMVAVLFVGGYYLTQANFIDNVSRIVVEKQHGGHADNAGDSEAEVKGEADASFDQDGGAQSQFADEGAAGEQSVHDSSQPSQDGGQPDKTSMSANPFEVALKYGSIMCMFAVITGYLEMALKRVRKRQ